MNISKEDRDTIKEEWLASLSGGCDYEYMENRINKLLGLDK